jgi:D-alanyl-lipoteichoic acid acyltransferase DltB (MBOAT superfamily)
MLFNSLEFAVFLPVVFFLYWFCTAKNLRLQNTLIVAASYVFYGWWDWRFLSIIFLSTLEDYFVALKIRNTSDERRRKMWLLTSIAVNLGFLGFFKYYNFFIDNFSAAFTLFGIRPNIPSLNIILPVGISFYTFQTMGYTIDVYRRKLEPVKDFISFAAFVSFFPQLVAGPIERAANLLPQFQNKRVFEYEKAVNGMRQILWGLFKKIVVADNCAVYVNRIFENYQGQDGSTLLLAAVFFAFQIYCDFSGYSDIAIGTARLFGFNLMRNFNFPYFSRDIAEFWRRWHISLTTWFRDYVYIPLGGSRVPKAKVVRNTIIIFLVSGFWHGANWTFIVWGALHAALFLPLILLHKNRKYTDTVADGKFLPNIKELFQMGTTFLPVVIGWIFFRAASIGQAVEYLRGIADKSLFSLEFLWAGEGEKTNIILILCMLAVEWAGRKNQFGLETLGVRWKRPYRWAMYLLIVFFLYRFAPTENIPFIYFQF